MVISWNYMHYKINFGDLIVKAKNSLNWLRGGGGGGVVSAGFEPWFRVLFYFIFFLFIYFFIFLLYTMNVFEAQMFPCNFLEGQNTCTSNVHYSSTRVANLATNPEILVARMKCQSHSVGDRISHNFKPWLPATSISWPSGRCVGGGGGGRVYV